MGPIELVFLTLLVTFGIIGVIRGYGRELGVTTMLLITLFVLEFLSESYVTGLNRVLSILAGADPARLEDTRSLLYCAILIIIVFISYEGETLSFPGTRGRIFFDLGSGLLNGYLFAGSLWYYLHVAGWPVLNLAGPFTRFYELAVKLLPPQVFKWQYLIGLAVFLLIARIWK